LSWPRGVNTCQPQDNNYTKTNLSDRIMTLKFGYEPIPGIKHFNYFLTEDPYILL